jgi:hypothetical protein
MTTEWVISEPTERVKLSGGKGQAAFTVTNPNANPDRVVFEVVPGDGAEGSWFGPPESPQRLVSGRASTTFLVTIAVPAGAAAGSYWLQGRAYSADTPPEEGSRLSGRIAFDVKATAKAKKPWWPYAVAAVLLVAVLGVIGFLVAGGDDGDGGEGGKPPANDCIAGFVWREAVQGDHVCVTKARHDQAQADNAQADSRREPNGGVYGPDTCIQGYVWRGATDTDHVCVVPQTRTETAEDNALADSRRAG